VEPIKLDGKYRLLEELGRGGMGTVFRARDESLDRDVAVKFLLPELQSKPDVVELFRREARAMASINNKNVVRVYSFGRYGAADFMVTEYIDGPTPEQVIDAAYGRKMLLSLRDIVDALGKAAMGLSAIHKAGVVHRDIKSGNVMVENSTDRVLIMDFGLGQKIDGGAKASMVAPRGTPAVMAPEIIASQHVEPAKEYLADIYAFGVLAYELCTNTLPFDGDTWVEVLEKHLEMIPPSIAERRDDLPAELSDMVARCLEKNPDDRYRSADEIASVLESIARRLPIEDGDGDHHHHSLRFR
jgi:serine/threonine-protein kinase